MPYWAYDYPMRIDYKARDEKFRMPWLHCHQTYEIYLLNEGHTNVMIGDQLQWISPGRAALFPPMVLHRNVSREKHSRWCLYFSLQYLNQHFTPETVNEMLRCFETPVLNLNKIAFDSLIALMKLLLAAQEQEDEGRYMLIPAILYILNNAKPSEGSSGCGENAVMHAISFINQGLKSIKTVDEIAAECYVSKEYLCRAFKKSTGFTITQYLNNLRVNLACELLKGSGMSVTDIALECGFSSPTYCGYVFKEQIGQTPSEFRKSVMHDRGL